MEQGSPGPPLSALSSTHRLERWSRAFFFLFFPKNLCGVNTITHLTPPLPRAPSQYKSISSSSSPFPKNASLPSHTRSIRSDKESHGIGSTAGVKTAFCIRQPTVCRAGGGLKNTTHTAHTDTVSRRIGGSAPRPLTTFGIIARPHRGPPMRGNRSMMQQRLHGRLVLKGRLTHRLLLFFFVALDSQEPHS